MEKKRKQYLIKQVKMEDIQVVDRKFVINKEPTTVSNSENLFYDLLDRLGEKEVNTEGKNTIDEFIILKTPTIKETDEDELAAFKKIITDGIWFNDHLYTREGAVKSASMTRTQKTLLIRSDLKEKVAEYTSIGKKPVKTIISKMETAKGLLLSSSMLLEDCMPNIVIIPDYEKTLLHDVNIVEEYNPTDEEKDEEEKQYLLDRETEFKRWEEVDQALEEAEEYKVLTSHALKKLQQRSSMEIYTYKTRSRWHKDENRRVRPEEIEHPQRYTKYEDKYYPCYHRNQTEEIKVFNIKPYSVGLEVNSYKNYPCKVNCFDGQGLADISWMERISEKMGLNYTTQGIQLRLPYIKGFIVSFPIKQWAKDNGVSKIKDIWGMEWDLFNDNIDMIITESCFKAKLEKSKEGIEQWLFSSMKDYDDSLEKYGFNKVGISSYVKSKYLKDLYTPITYQHIYAFNLNDKAIRAIVNKTGRLGLEIKNAKDISFTKAYLNMLSSYKEDELEADEDNLDTEGEELEASVEEEYVNIIHKALDINHRMLFDPHIRSFLVNQARKLWRQLLLGRAYIKGGYIYATGDCIAFMEHSFGLEVKGFLRRKQLYCHGKAGEHILIRNPITHYSEVIKAHFIKSNDNYVRHLNNVVQFSAGYDLLMAQSNLDYDGDKLLVTNDPVLLANKIEAPVIYNPGDKATAEPMEYNLENILAYELMNLNNSTGRVTNINSTFCDRAMERGEEGLPSKDFEITICKHLQGLIIDSVKSMKKVDIPEVLENATRKKPYFLSHKYGDYKTKITNYKAKEKSNSPFNEFVKRLENSINSTFKTTYGDIIDIDFLDIQNTKELLQDRSKYDTATFFDIIEKLQPIYKEYIRGRDNLNNQRRKINYLDKSEENKELIKEINGKFKEFYDEIRTKCLAICSNHSVLASCCVEISYNYTKNKNDSGFRRNTDYSFPWRIIPEGIVENLKANEEDNKIDVYELRGLNHRNREFEGLLKVQDGIARIDDVELKVDLEDGNYQLYNILGQHFTDVDVVREEKVNVVISPIIKTEIDLNPLENYQVKLIKLQGKEPDHIIEKIKNGFILRSNDKDVCLYCEGEYLATIRFEDVVNKERRIDLNDYIGKGFKLEDIIEITETKKSMTITISLNS